MIDRFYINDNDNNLWFCLKTDTLNRQEYAIISMFNFGQILPLPSLFGTKMRSGLPILVKLPRDVSKRLALPPIEDKVFELELATYKGEVCPSIFYKIKIHKSRKGEK